MFKNLTIFRAEAGSNPSRAIVESALALSRFTPCSATQESSAGWIAPRGEAHGALIEVIADQWILRLMSEKKMLPASVINRLADERAESLEATTGRKLGRVERKSIKEETRLDLLPKAFSRESSTWVWINLRDGLVVVDTASASKADEVVGHLLKAFDGLTLTPLQAAQSPGAVMAAWLSGTEPEGAFELDRECELQATDEPRSKVRYTKHNLAIDEIRQHVRDGKLPTQVGLTWDGRLSLVLSSTLHIKKIKFLEGVITDDGNKDVHADRFDADVAITTGELTKLIEGLIVELGGAQEPV
jgi:recombination associated protein RdgC